VQIHPGDGGGFHRLIHRAGADGVNFRSPMFADDPRDRARDGRCAGIGRDLDDGDRDSPPTPAIAGIRSRALVF
jgi:hypothetical protein